MENMLRVGVITSTHGVHGEVKIFPTTDDPSRYKKLKYVMADTKRGTEKLELERVKFFKKYVIVKFKGIQSIDEAERYKGMDLLIDRENAVPLEEGEYFIADLIGLRILTEDGTELGILTDVLQTGANDVYVVELPNKKELLLPAIRQCILETDMEAGIMKVHIMEGLM